MWKIASHTIYESIAYAISDFNHRDAGKTKSHVIL